MQNFQLKTEQKSFLHKSSIGNSILIFMQTFGDGLEKMHTGTGLEMENLRGEREVLQAMLPSSLRIYTSAEWLLRKILI